MHYVTGVELHQLYNVFSRRESLLQCGEKSSHHLNKKKLRPMLNRAGRIQKKCELGWRNISPGPRSTSPDSPVHGGAAAKPVPVVRTNPMYSHTHQEEAFSARVRALGEHW